MPKKAKGSLPQRCASGSFADSDHFIENLGQNLLQSSHAFSKIFASLIDQSWPDGDVDHLVPAGFFVPVQKVCRSNLRLAGVDNRSYY